MAPNRPPSLDRSHLSAPQLATLPNGLRVVAIPMPWRATASLSVFIRTGSLNETPARLNGLSHVVEHMAFKGTATRDCQRINLDAERLGAEVNAHTDKDHTAYHLEGLPQDLPAFVDLLADLVLNPVFPADELERELRVIEQEFTEFDEDPVTQAFMLFDRACYGTHPAGQPVIGRRANLKRFKREDLVAYVRRQYSACNVVVAVAGPVDFAALVRAVEAAFGAMPAGTPNAVDAPQWLGGLKTRRMAGAGQCQAVLGFEAPAAADDGHVVAVLAAAVLGEGMSSPLLDEVRERRGLAYHASCTADIQALSGQILIEAATAPEQTEEFLIAVDQLLRRQAESIATVDLERARKQLTVRALRSLEQPARRLESAAQELFTLGRLRDTHEWLDRLQAVTADQVQALFQRVVNERRAAVALTGTVPVKVKERAQALFF